MDVFEYTVCDDTGACETALVTVRMADLRASKTLIVSTPSATPGNIDITFEIRVRNTGSTTITNLTAIEDLGALVSKDWLVLPRRG